MHWSHLFGSGLLLIAIAAAAGCRDSDPTPPPATEPAPATAAAPSVPVPVKEFSPIRQMKTRTDGTWEAISFTQGTLFEFESLKPGATPEEKAAREKWMLDRAIDGFVYGSEPDFVVSITTGTDTASLVVDNAEWEKMSPAELEQRLTRPEARKGGGAGTNVENSKPVVTFIFRTIHAVKGIAQLKREGANDQSWATLKTKILQAAPTPKK